MSTTKNDIVTVIAQSTELEQQKVKVIVQMTLDRIIETLAREGRIELRNFGVFEVRLRKARKARNPRTGADVVVASKKVVAFKAGKLMADRIEMAEPPAEAAPAADPAPDAPPAAGAAT